jgi:hypothetical protein
MLLKILLALSLALNFTACSTSTNGNVASSAGEGTRAETSAPPAASSSVEADTAGVTSAGGQSFRGEIGERPIVMRLQRSAENLSGSYFYEGIGQNLTLKGRVDAQGKLSLQEFDASGKQTGKFEGQWANESDQEPSNKIEGQWSQPDGSHQIYFQLTEQHVEFNNNLQIVSKTIRERRPSVNVSYPQVAGSNDPAIAGFNRQAQNLITKAIKEFKEGNPAPDRASYTANYNVLLATDDLISVEILADYDAGGAHPDTDYYTLNYDLRTGRELQLKDLFKPNADYRKAIQQYALKDMNARAKRDAQQENMPPDQQTEELFSQDQLSEWKAWAMSRRGIFVYYDLPHVIAVYSREFIPSSVLKDQLDQQRAPMK